MANTLQIKRGANADLPTLNAGEFGFSTDTHQIYIGDGVDNHEIAKVGDVHYVGTTEIANNRASSAQGLDGITSLTPGADFTLVSALGDALKMTNASGNISLFSDSASGETPSFSISGFKTGDALRTVDFDFADVADTLSITGASNYYIDGNLGIGSTIPQKKLHINYGDLRISYGPTSNFDVSQTSTGGVVNIRNSSGVSVIGLDARTNTGSPAFSVIGKDSLSTTIVGNIRGSTGTGLVVTGAGNVGIGTTTPSDPLQVSGNIRCDGLKVNSSSFIGSEEVYVSGGVYLDGSGNTIINNGSVGIGTASPITRFHNTGGLSVNITTVNAATYDLLITDYILHVTYTGTAAVTSLTLPTAQTTAGRTIVIKDAGGNASVNNITIDTEGSEKIDGQDTLIISSDYESKTLYSDGSNWFIM